MHCGFVQGSFLGILLGSVWVYWVVGSLRGSLRGLLDPMRGFWMFCMIPTRFKTKNTEKVFLFFYSTNICISHINIDALCPRSPSLDLKLAFS